MKHGSDEAEVGVIGSCLIDPVKSIYLCHEQKITEAHFHDPRRRLVYASLMEFAESKGAQLVDTLSVGEWMTRKGIFKQLGDPALLTKFVDDTPSTSNCEYYISILQHYGLQRSGKRMLKVALEELTNGSDPKEVITNIVNDSMRLTDDVSSQQTPQQIHDELREDWKKAKAQGFSGFPSTFPTLQHVLGSYMKPDNIIIAGKPSDGKTTLGCNEWLNLARHDVPVCIFSLEMTEKALRARIAGSMARVNTFLMRIGKYEDRHVIRLDRAFEELEKLPLYILSGRRTMGEIQSAAVNMKARYGIEVFGVDYLQLLKPGRREQDKSPTQIIGEWSACLKELGQKLDACTMVLSQLNRGGHRDRTTTPPPPTLEALRQSGEIEQNADVVVMTYKRPGLDWDIFSSDADWPMDISVEKNRNGPTGTVPFVFIRRLSEFMDEERYDMEV